MDEDTILVLLKTRLEVAELHETTLTIDCGKWDRGLGLPEGSTARFMDRATQGSRFSIALRGNQVIRVALADKAYDPLTEA